MLRPHILEVHEDFIDSPNMIIVSIGSQNGNICKLIVLKPPDLHVPHRLHGILIPILVGGFNSSETC